MTLPITGKPNLATLTAARLLCGRPSLPGTRRAMIPFRTQEELEKIVELCVAADRNDAAERNEIEVIALAHSGKWFGQLVILDAAPAPGRTREQELTEEIMARLEYFRKECSKPPRAEDGLEALENADFLKRS